MSCDGVSKKVSLAENLLIQDTCLLSLQKENHTCLLRLASFSIGIGILLKLSFLKIYNIYVLQAKWQYNLLNLAI